ncbi:MULTISPECIES: SLAC1 anion channel family protein [Thermodesulfovibrio]|jgi:tellurite resistance protein|uniref:SLAC1 anion channel family protein n=1 Tax=Thermodesulfovibrio TaxID=28261 RepID=UPI002635514C|nr:SLAC1 anion channel family protein [Thermodesulfovibrio sp.]
MENSRVKNFPVSFFAVVMGLTGLAIAYTRLSFVGDIFVKIGYGITFLASIIFLILLSTYLLKIVKYMPEVKKEFHHPVKSSFFPTISISMLLLSISYEAINDHISLILWVFGTLLHFSFLIRIITYWINHEFKIEMINPAWFIPVVGTIIVPIQGVRFDYEISWFFFSIGIIFWITLFTIVFYRFIFHHPLPDRLYPTFFILIAPPAVGFISYTKIVGSIDTLGNLLFYFALFLSLVLVAMIKKFINLRFYISWWAYTFPLDAVTIALTLRYHLTASPFYYGLSLLSIIVTTLVIGVVSVKTLIAISKREICVEE